MDHKQTIYVAGGCFWCTEAVFKNLRGVLDVVPGYTGGTDPHPTYEMVCRGTTGHAEAIKIVYDDSVISTADLLDVFFATHDPSTKNQQGNDVGTQYRSAIFYTNDAQKIEVEKAIARAQASLADGKHVVTEVVPASTFYPAEDYHKDYYASHRDTPYCQLVIDPKIEKLQKTFHDKLA